MPVEIANVVMSKTCLNMSICRLTDIRSPLAVLQPSLEIGVQETMKEMLSGFATH